MTNVTNNRPLISILVPVYNVEDYIRECIESILMQEMSDYEVVLVDDGSKDSSGQICDEYCEKYPDKFRVIHKANEGLISARRVGIREAIGDYCIFLDSDDLLTKNCLSVLKEAVAECKHDMVLYRYAYYVQETHNRKEAAVLFSQDTVFEGEQKRVIYENLVLNNKINNLFIKMIKREILQSDPTDYTKYYDNSFGEDLLQSLYPVTVSKSITYINQVLYLYRIHEGSMIHKFDPKTMWKRYKGPVDGLVIEYMNKWGIGTENNLLKRDASSLKNMVDTLVSHLKYASDKASVKNFANEFVETSKLTIQKVLKSDAVLRRQKFAIGLLNKRWYCVLVLYYDFAAILLKLKRR